MVIESKPRARSEPKGPAIMRRPRTGRRGPPPYAPTDEHRQLVEGMVGLGLKRVDVASLMGISPTTLREHFRAELRNGDAKAIYNVATGLYKNATTPTKRYPGGDVAAQIFFLKVRAGWRETTRHEMTGPDGEPIAHAYDVKDLQKLPLDELVRLYQQAVAAPNRG